jgi:hypothetical protein
MKTCVWAFRRLPELNGALEFVECDEEIAATLIAAGKVQDPRDGATALRTVDPTPLPAPKARGGKHDDGEYDTKVITPKNTRSK